MPNLANVMVPVYNASGCVIGWKVRVTGVPAGLTVRYDKDSVMSQLVDAEGCVKGWALNVAPAPAPVAAKKG